MKYKYDGMRYPAIDQLVGKTNSKYRLVLGVAIRSRQLIDGDCPRVNAPVNKTPIGIALEEIYEDKTIIKEPS